MVAVRDWCRYVLSRTVTNHRTDNTIVDVQKQICIWALIISRPFLFFIILFLKPTALAPTVRDISLVVRDNGFKRFDKTDQIIHDTKVGHIENGRMGIGVNGDHIARCVHSGDVLA